MSRKLKGIYNDQNPTEDLAARRSEISCTTCHVTGFMGTMISTTAAVKNALGVEIPEINVVGDQLIVEGEDFDYAIESGKFSPAQILMAIITTQTKLCFTGKSSGTRLGIQDGYVCSSNLRKYCR